MDQVQPGGPISMARMKEIAAQAVDPCVTSSMVVAAFWQEARASEIDPKAGYDAIHDEAEAVRDGVMTSAQATLVGQALALNAIFAELARRGAAAPNRPGNAAEKYLRLAMKAQSQCRATLNVLSEFAEGPDQEEADRTPQYTKIERVIVYPPRYDEQGNVIPGSAERQADWRKHAHEVRCD
jgi:hypothetical protein